MTVTHDEFEAWRAGDKAREAEVLQRLGFDNSQDAASVIVRFMNALKDIHSEDRDDPFLAAMIEKWNTRYEEAKHGVNYRLANNIATIEAIRTIISSFEVQK